MTDDLRVELEAQRSARSLPVDLLSLVEHSTLMPERSVRAATILWLRGQSPEARQEFAKMLEGAAQRAELTEEDEALADEAIDEWLTAHASHRYFVPGATQ